jgi:hypothetical protein
VRKYNLRISETKNLRTTTVVNNQVMSMMHSILEQRYGNYVTQIPATVRNKKL